MNTHDLAEQNLIYKVRCGSHAYGTNLPTSDVDYAGIFIPPADYFFGLQAFDLLSEQSEVDRSYYSLRKYAHLAVANNPNVLELLFTDDRDILFSTSASTALRNYRHLFLSRRCQKTFVGYAKAQLHRIRTHTKWLEQEIKDMDTLWTFVMNEHVTASWVAWRFGDNMLKRIAQEFETHEKFQTQIVGGPCDLLRTAKNHFYKSGDNAYEPQLLEAFKGSSVICPDQKDIRFFKQGQPRMFNGVPEPTWEFQKHLYDEAKKKRDQYVTWMAERNPARHETEIKFGYDTKHAMHLVRLLRMGYEILTTGDLKVRRPDAAELLDIRAGKWTYGEVTNYADGMVDRIDSIPADQFQVPELPDITAINTLVIKITKEYLASEKQTS